MKINARKLEGKVYPSDLVQKLRDNEIELGFYTSKNEDGEDLIVEIKEDYVRIDTIQNNGWIRINCYYLDGIKTETYKK